VMEAGFHWNYTSWLNVAFLALTAMLLWRFARTGGIAMLREMSAIPPDSRGPEQHTHHH